MHYIATLGTSSCVRAGVLVCRKIHLKTRQQKMWRLILVTALTYIFGVATRSIEPFEGPLWSHRIADAVPSPEDSPSMNFGIFEQRSPKRNTYDPDADYNIILMRPPNDKRALAMFARWGPINTFGKEISPIRSSNLVPEDFISTQTRGRTPGQPLRWG